MHHTPCRQTARLILLPIALALATVLLAAPTLAQSAQQNRPSGDAAYAQKRLTEAWRRASNASRQDDAEALQAVNAVKDSGDYHALLAYLESCIASAEGKQLEQLHRERHGLSLAKGYKDEELDSALALADLKPRNFVYWRWVAVAQTKHSRIREAIESIERALILIAGQTQPQVRMIEARLHHEAADRMFDLDDYENAQPHVQASLEINLEILGPGHPMVARNFNDLARVEHHRGNYEEAIRLYQKAQAIDLEARGPDHPTVGQYEQNIGLVLVSQGKPLEALPRYLKALEMDRTHPTGPRNLNATLVNLGSLYIRLGELDKAEPLLVEAVEVCRTQLGDRHPVTADTLTHLGDLRKAQGRFEEATKLHLEAAEIHALAGVNDTKEQASSLIEAGAAAQRLGNFDAAINHFKQAEAIEREVYGHHSHEVAQTLRWLGGTYYKARDLRTAVSAFQEAATILERVSPTSSDLADTYGQLGYIALESGSAGHSVAMFERALEVVRTSTDDTPESLDELTATYLSNAAAGLIELGHFEEAAARSREARQMIETRPTLSHIPSERRALYLSNEASALAANKRFTEADILFDRALAIYRDDYDNKHVGMAEIHRKIGLALFRRDRADEALPHLQQSRALFEELTPDQPANIALVAVYTGQTLVKIGDLEEAIAQFRDADRLYAEIGDDARASRGAVHEEIALALKLLGRTAEAEEATQTAAEFLGRRVVESTNQAAQAELSRGRSLARQGRDAEALEHFLEAERILLAIGADKADVATVLNDIGFALRGLGRDDEAVGRFAARERMLRELYGDDDSRVGDPICARAEILEDQGRYTEAIEAFSEAHRIFSLDEEQGTMQAVTAVRAADSYAALGMFAEAYRLYVAASEQQTDLFGREDEFVASSTGRAGWMLVEMERAEEAMPWLDESIELRQATTPDNASDLAHLFIVRARAHTLLSQPEGAAADYQEGIHLTRLAAEPDHEHRVVVLLMNVAYAQEAAQVFDSAIEAALEAGQIARDLYGKDDPRVGVALQFVGSAHRTSGNLDKAKAYGKAGFKILFKSVGPGDNMTLAAALNLLESKVDAIDYARSLSSSSTRAVRELETYLENIYEHQGMNLDRTRRSIRDATRTRAPGT
ncbi:MAG: tetratricopeptide repeat protein [Planctomycetota bacterium]